MQVGVAVVVQVGPAVAAVAVRAGVALGMLVGMVGVRVVAASGHRGAGGADASSIFTNR